MKLVRVVRRFDESVLSVVVRHDDGELRAIDFVWQAKDGPLAPMPEHWRSLIEQEAEAARDLERNPNREWLAYMRG